MQLKAEKEGIFTERPYLDILIVFFNKPTLTVPFGNQGPNPKILLPNPKIHLF